jgi:predicted acetyltransferase
VGPSPTRAAPAPRTRWWRPSETGPRGTGVDPSGSRLRESNSRARRLYERTGFRHTGDSVKRGGVAEVVMRLDLPPRVELTAPREDLAEPFLEMAREWRESGEDAYAAALDDFEGYLSRLARHAEGRDLRPGRVPYLVLWLIGEDRRVLGTSRLRLGLTPGLEKEGGHIGYDVRPSERRKGYATALLARTLDEARARGHRRRPGHLRRGQRRIHPHHREQRRRAPRPGRLRPIGQDGESLPDHGIRSQAQFARQLPVETCLARFPGIAGRNVPGTVFRQGTV